MAAETISEVEQKIKVLETERQQLFEKREPIDEALSENYHKLDKLKKTLGKLKTDGPGFTDEELILYNPLTEGVVYNAQKKFAEIYGLQSSGYLPSTEKNGLYQKGFEICFHRKNHPQGWTLEQQINKVVEFFNKFKDKMLPTKDGFYFGVFEHTLSEYGCYHVTIKSEEDATLYRTTYGHTSILKSGTLKEVLLLVAEKHYYE